MNPHSSPVDVISNPSDVIFTNPETNSTIISIPIECLDHTLIFANIYEHCLHKLALPNLPAKFGSATLPLRTPDGFIYLLHIPQFSVN